MRQLLLCLLFAGVVLAQRDKASIAGQVLDVSQGVIPGAKIVVRHLTTGVDRSATSNTAGFYVVSALPAGPYSIAVTHEGFQAYNIPEIILQVDQQATVNAELRVGAERNRSP